MKRLVLVLALATLAVSGCSTGDEASPVQTSSTTSIAATTTTTSPPPATITPTEASTPISIEPTFEEPVYETTEAIAFVDLGEYCSTRGASATTASGLTAYCSRLAGTDAWIWSTTQGVAPNAALETTYVERPRVYPTEDESFIQTCMVKSGASREACIANIQAGIDAGNIRVN